MGDRAGRAWLWRKGCPVNSLELAGNFKFCLPTSTVQATVSRTFEVSQISLIKRDEIAADTRYLLLQHMPKGTKLRLADVLELFKLMR